MASKTTVTCDSCGADLSQRVHYKLAFDEQKDLYLEYTHKRWDVCSVLCAQAVLETFAKRIK